MNNILVAPIAFNEKLKLQNVIERFLASSAFLKVDYLVVDDGSTDGTPEVIASYAHQGVGTLRHDQQQGVGAAIRSAIRYAQEHHYRILVIMAGNDKDDPNEIMLLTHPISDENYDFIQGSRYLKGGSVGGDMPFYRKMATRFHPWLMSLITARTVTDSTNGFRAMKMSVFEDTSIDLDQSWLDHYELEPYLLFKVLTRGYRVKEVPVTKIYPSRKLGYTKMRPITGWWSILKPLVYLGLHIKK